MGELMKRFKTPRPVTPEFAARLKAIDPERGENLAKNLERGLMAIPLVAHEALTTAYINDVDGLGVFAQQLFGFGRHGDVFLGISTSGNSKNVMSMDIKYELYKFDRSKPSFEVVNTIIAKGDNSYFNIDGEEYFPKTEDGEYTGESIPNLKKRTNEKVNEILKNAVGGGFEPGEKESVSIGRAFNYIFEY